MTISRNFITSLERGLSVLAFLASRNGSVSLTDLAEGVDLSISTMQRFTYTLQKLGYIERNQKNRKFQLGTKVLTLAPHFLNNSDLFDITYPHLQKLAEGSGETVNINILEGSEIIYVQRILTNHSLLTNIRLGSRVSAHSSAAGKAILASLSENQLKNVLNRLDFKAVTPKTITKRADFREALNIAKAQGFATNDEELIIGVRAVAAPIKNPGIP